MLTSSFGMGAVSTGEQYLAMRPKLATAAPKVGILYCHASNGQAAEAQYFGGVHTIVAALVSAGHPVLACELGGATTWGNDTSLARVTTARSYLQASMGARPGKVALLGLSMGGLTALAWAGANSALTAGVVGLIPVVNIADIHTSNRGGATATINAAYGGAYSDATLGATHNPQRMAAAGKYAGIPIRTYYGDSDAICVPATQTAFASSSGAITTRLTGGHASSTIEQIDPAEIVTFFGNL